MKIGILSDTHDQRENLETALTVLRSQGISVLIHCGDLTSPGIAALFSGFRVIHVRGNGDTQPAAILQELRGANPDSVSLAVYKGRLGGKNLAAVHGHHPGSLEELTSSGAYDYIFHGHSHRRRDVRIGSSRVINPGALGGKKDEARSFCILDLESDTLTIQWV